jgi:stage V sporulation protein K
MMKGLACMNNQNLAYAKKYTELGQVTLQYLLTVDTADKVPPFITQATRVIREVFDRTPELNAKAFMEILKSIMIAKIDEETAYCRQEIAAAKAEGQTAGSELTARLQAARRAGDHAAEQAVWRDRAARQASCQARVDAARKRANICSLQIDAYKELALVFGVKFPDHRPPVRAKQSVPLTSTPAKSSIEPSSKSLGELLRELDALTGLGPVKATVHQLVDMAQVDQMRRAKGLPVAQVSRHLVFTGNPGTGKTTVARLLARLYTAIGALKTGQLVEVSRSDLVAGYVGQTAIKTKEAVEQALGGILFIDEAYALSRGAGLRQDYGQEAIDTLVKLMEDHRDELVIIAAGYSDEMGQFLSSNPGLPSRFPHVIEFPDYSTDGLVAIYRQMCLDGRYEISVETLNLLRHYLDGLARMRGFGNGRLVRNIFESTLARQASRIIATNSSDLTRLTSGDLGLPSEEFSAAAR